jgi:D-alanine-D-alanine ligase
LNIPYACPDILASAVGMDKFISKLLFKEAGLPVLEGLEISRHDYESVAKIANMIKAEFDYPVIVKPVNTGSSLGITVVKEEATLQNALDEAFRRSNRLIVEPALSNFREINCSVYGDESTDVAIASECEELKTSNEILSFEDKYQGDQWMAGEHRIFPAELTEREKAVIKVAAVDAFKALHCSGIARVDFMISQDGKIYLNEINTIPGALSAGLWQSPSEMTYEEVLERIIKDAIRRKRTDDQLNYSSGEQIDSISGNFGNKGI